MSEWQPIESAPRDGSTILAWGENDNTFLGRWLGSGWFDEYDSPCGPTRWMPLPEPPKA